MPPADLLSRQIEAARKKLNDEIKTERKLKEERQRYEEKWKFVGLIVALLAITARFEPQMFPPAVGLCCTVLCIALLCALCDLNPRFEKR